MYSLSLLLLELEQLYLKVMDKRVSKCLRQGRIRYKGQFDSCEPPRGNHVDRGIILPIGYVRHYKSISGLMYGIRQVRECYPPFLVDIHPHPT
jgi:hypothetical protein